MRVATTIGQLDSGKWVTIECGEDIDGQLARLKELTDSNGVMKKGDKEQKLKQVYVLTTSRPIAKRKFKK